MADTPSSGGFLSNLNLNNLLNSGATLFAGLEQSKTNAASEKSKAQAAKAAQLQAQQNSTLTTKLLIGGGAALALVVVIALVFRSRN